MAILPQEIPHVYTGTTRLLDRFPPATVTEELAQYREIPDATPYLIGVLLFVAVFLILGACWVVVRVGSEALAALLPFPIAGFLWVAFGRDTGDAE